MVGQLEFQLCAPRVSSHELRWHQTRLVFAVSFEDDEGLSIIGSQFLFAGTRGRGSPQSDTVQAFVLSGREESTPWRWESRFQEWIYGWSETWRRKAVYLMWMSLSIRNSCSNDVAASLFGTIVDDIFVEATTC